MDEMERRSNEWCWALQSERTQRDGDSTHTQDRSYVDRCDVGLRRMSEVWSGAKGKDGRMIVCVCVCGEMGRRHVGDGTAAYVQSTR